ncbi:hypothetical protein NN561_001949 [Cricetulus griseus]
MTSRHASLGTNSRRSRSKSSRSAQVPPPDPPIRAWPHPPPLRPASSSGFLFAARASWCSPGAFSPPALPFSTVITWNAGGPTRLVEQVCSWEAAVLSGKGSIRETRAARARDSHPRELPTLDVFKIGIQKNEVSS